jgi:type II secretory pathway component PulL
VKSVLQKPRGWAAIFFGETALELATTRPAGVNIDRQAAASLPAEEGAEPQARLAAAVQQLRPQVDPREHHIVTAISGEDVLCQMVRLPTTDPNELKQMLDLQIDNLTPLPVDEMVYSFESQEQTSTETRLLVAMASKARVNERVAVLEAAGLPPAVVAIDTLAVFRELVRRNLLPSDENLNALVLISPTAANILVHSRGNLIAMRSLMISGIAEPEAQSAVKEELQRTLVAAEIEQPGSETGRVTFATWNEALRAGVGELAQAWGANAEFLSNGSSPVPSVSVCLETARAGATRLNLLPDEWRERRRAAKLRRTLIRGGIAVGAAYLLVLVVGLAVMAIQNARVSGVTNKIKALHGQYVEAKTLQKTLVAMQKQLDTKFSALEVLRETSLLMPDNVKLNGFLFKKDDAITLRAQAQSAALATEYISRLEKSELFSKVATGSMRSEPGSGLTKFDVVCTLKSAAPAAVTGGSWR